MADALSRKPSHDSYCAAISTCTPLWIQEVLGGYQNDQEALSMVAKLSIDPSAVAHFTIQEVVLRYKGRIWVGQNPILQHKLLGVCLSSAVGVTLVLLLPT